VTEAQKEARMHELQALPHIRFALESVLTCSRTLTYSLAHSLTYSHVHMCMCMSHVSTLTRYLLHEPGFRAKLRRRLPDAMQARRRTPPAGAALLPVHL